MQYIRAYNDVNLNDLKGEKEKQKEKKRKKKKENNKDYFKNICEDLGIPGKGAYNELQGDYMLNVFSLTFYFMYITIFS